MTGAPARILARILGMALGCLAASAWGGVFSTEAEDAEALTQQRTALRLEIDGLSRVHDTLFNLETAAVALCGDAAVWIPGFEVATSARFGDAREAAAESLGFERLPRVMYVARRSAAARAGLHPGDLIAAVNGNAIEPDEDAWEAVGRLLARAPPGETVRIEVRRGEAETLDIGFRPERACDYRPRLMRSHVVNAAITDDTLYVTTGLLDYLDGEAELAAVLAHELGHDMMSHVAKRLGNLLLGKAMDQVLSLAAGPAGSLLVKVLKPGERLANNAYALAFEEEADFVALYLMAQAGYEIADAPRLWRKLAVEFPGLEELSYLATHPVPAERVLVQDLTVDEIRAHRAAGLPLLPEMERRLGRMTEKDVR